MVGFRSMSILKDGPEHARWGCPFHGLRRILACVLIGGFVIAFPLEWRLRLGVDVGLRNLQICKVGSRSVNMACVGALLSVRESLRVEVTAASCRVPPIGVFGFHSPGKTSCLKFGNLWVLVSSLISAKWKAIPPECHLSVPAIR
jgi:hypothetical protein